MVNFDKGLWSVPEAGAEAAPADPWLCGETD